MRIALVSGHFSPEAGYQEVNLARVFAKLGNTVTVFTSTKVSPSLKKIIKDNYSVGWQNGDNYGFKILRLPTIISWGSSIICFGLKKKVRAFNPDLVVIIGIGKIFPYSLLIKENRRKFKLISLFGDNSDFNSWSSLTLIIKSIKRIFSHRLFKKWLYRKAVKNCDKLVLYTPETELAISAYLTRKTRKTLLNKKVISTLGFEGNIFYYSEKERLAIRNELSIDKDECILITATRITPSKQIGKVIEAISELHRRGKNLRYILIGFLNDLYEAEVKKSISQQKVPDIFHCYPFYDQQILRKYFCAADIGIWNNAAISIQQAMGTGLPVILENKLSVNHLIKNGINGWLYDKKEFFRILENAITEVNRYQGDNREKVREYNSVNLSYENIAKTIIDSVQLN